MICHRIHKFVSVCFVREVFHVSSLDQAIDILVQSWYDFDSTSSANKIPLRLFLRYVSLNAVYAHPLGGRLMTEKRKVDREGRRNLRRKVSSGGTIPYAI